MESREFSVSQKDGSKKKYKIEYEREKCIGAAACIAVDPGRWSMADDGRADLKGAKQVNGNEVQVLEISLEEFDKFMEAAQSCPVTVIHIIDLNTGERLI